MQTHIDNVDVNFSLLKKEVAPSQLQLDTWLRRHYKENSIKVSLKVNILHYFPTIKTYDNNKFLSNKYELVAEISTYELGMLKTFPLRNISQEFPEILRVLYAIIDWECMRVPK